MLGVGPGNLSARNDDDTCANRVLKSFFGGKGDHLAASEGSLLIRVLLSVERLQITSVSFGCSAG